MKITRRLLSTLLVGLLALLGSQAPASAAQFCVNSAASLQTALTTAASNGVDDEVRIVQGTYVGNFVYASTQANKLSVLGGYTAGCAGRTLDPVNTILDGNQTSTVLSLSTPGPAEFLVEGLTLRKGNAGWGGGLYAQVSGLCAVTITRNRLENNKAHFGGGAEVNCFDGTVSLTNNSITSNTAFEGGGASIDATTVTLTNNSIAGNTGSYGWGGGINIDATTATLINNSIMGNMNLDGYDGGGAKIDATTATLTNNNITGNTSSSGGGGASIDATTALLTNNLFWDNVATTNGGADLLINAAPVTLLHNNFDQSPAGFKINYPITIDPSNWNAEDPLFVNQAAGNLRLATGSPMIDAGDPDTPDLPLTDAAGGLRVINGIVDIGALEYHEYESCDSGPGLLAFSGSTFDAGGDHHESEVGIATEGNVEMLAEAEVVLRAPLLSFGPGFRIETGAQFLAIAGPVTCNQ